MGELLAALLPEELRQSDRARAAVDVIGDALEALIGLRASAPAKG